MVHAPAFLTNIISLLWTEAAPEQRHLTTQLARNSFYFATAIIIIKQFGEQIAI